MFFPSSKRRSKLFLIFTFYLFRLGNLTLYFSFFIQLLFLNILYLINWSVLIQTRLCILLWLNVITLVFGFNISRIKMILLRNSSVLVLWLIILVWVYFRLLMNQRKTNIIFKFSDCKIQLKPVLTLFICVQFIK